MDFVRFLLTFVFILALITDTSGCFCDHYPWSPWSFCTRTCGQGNQQRTRNVQYDDHWLKNNCGILCQTSESRTCNVEACPINCLLTEFGPWSECSPCAEKQFRIRSVLRPAQFGGVDCSESLMEDRPCYSSKECKIEKVACKDKFKCDNGRCINAVLECNGQNDCLDNSDERNCAKINQVCANARVHVLPGVDLIGNGFDAMARQMRGAVLENSIMGEKCNITRSRENRRRYRLPANIEYYEIKVEQFEDIKENPPVKTEQLDLKSTSLAFGWKEEINALQEKESKYFRVHQVIATSTFQTKSSDLYLSHPFLTFLNSLPLEYNYPLYRQIFQQFGTHYFGSGTLGGQYDLLFQFDSEKLQTKGLSDNEVKGCVHQDSSIFLLIYWSSSYSTRCGTNKETTSYEGSFLQTSEKCISSVKGGRAEYAAALSWEQKQVPPESSIYRDWINSTIDNPTVINYELRPLVDLVRGFPCAVTKRRHLQKALDEYLATFDSCKCAPCPNNAHPALSGTECVCICQTGTYGPNCENRARSYTSEAVDGYWSCWSSWSACDSSLKRHRTRSCNNPAPQRGGKPCQGPQRQEEKCTVSIFQSEDVCINDDDFEVEGDGESVLPPGVSGCTKPKPPANGYLRLNKRVYDHGDHEEFVCFTGYQLEGYQLIHCKHDGTWEEPKGSCIKMVCSRPKLPNEVSVSLDKLEYPVGANIMLSCSGAGFSLSGPRYYSCGNTLSWTPNLPENIQCKTDEHFIPDSRCSNGERHDGSRCVCIPRDDCRKYREDLCVLDAVTGGAAAMSVCGFHAGRCHGDKLHFMNDGACKGDVASLDWARFRARLAEKSAVQQPCGADTCYEWETCSALEKCVCKPPRDCPQEARHMYCVNIRRQKRQRTMNQCSMAAMKCGGIDLEILHEGECTAS
ncbi:complement component C6 isoform X1 [Trichomycterus rosablanca]|uniref:complement component C6 isoform X1 n=1 Tax=Trichomycterus rosablanca TaxID=2290929 RepID=UPI002F35A26C